MAAPSQPPAPVHATGITRTLTIPSCTLTASDLRKLFRLLQQKASEASDRQLAGMVQQPGQTQTQFEEARATARTAMSLLIRLWTKGGGWMGTTTIQPLEDEELPDNITKIEFDLGLLFRLRFNNLSANNTFLVSLDLQRPSILDMNPQPALNGSTANISGNDTTWANGLADELIQFFQQSKNRRGLLHLSESYTLLLFPVGFPLSFDIVYHLDKFIRRVGALPEALSVAIYVYCVVMVLYLFRLLFNYARWVFPKVELNAPRQHIGARHRVAITTLALIVIGALVKAGLKLFGVG